MRAVILFALVWIWPALATAAQPPSASPDGIDLLVAAIQQAAQAGDPLALRSLARLDTDAGQLADFVNAMTSPAPSKATIKERDRARLMSGRQRLMLEVLIEHAREGRVSTWRVDVAPPESPAPTGPDAPWQIASVQRLTIVGGLHRLQLDATTEYDVRNLTVDAIDLKLSLPAGTGVHRAIRRWTDGRRSPRPRPGAVLTAPEGGAGPDPYFLRSGQPERRVRRGVPPFEPR